MVILPTPRLNVHPTPNEIQVAAAELDRLIFKNQKQEKIYIYRRQCPATNGNRSSGEAEEKEGVAGGGELITYIFFVTKELAAQGELRRFLSHGSPDDAEISVN